MAINFKKSLEVRYMEEQWEFMTDAYKGNIAIRSNSKKQTYLRKFPKESDAVYNDRSAFSVYNNLLKPEIDNVGQTPFRNDLIYNQKFNEDWKKVLMKDCDMKNTSFKNLLEDAFTNCLLYGVHAVFTDYSGEKPFFESIKAPQIIGVWGDYDSEGNYRLDRFIFFKDFLKYSENADKTYNDYKEYVVRRIVKLTHPNKVEVYEATIYDSNKSGMGTMNSNASVDYNYGQYEFDYNYNDSENFVKVSEKTIDTEKIPVEFLFSDKRLGIIRCICPYFDNARLNLSLYNKSSNRDNILKIAAFPLLKATGITDGADRKRNFADQMLSPNRVIMIESEKGDVNFIETEGKSIEQIRQDIRELQINIVQKSQEWINQNKNAITATGSRIDESNQISHIKGLAGRIQEFANKCLMHFANYASLSESEKEYFKLSISTDFEYLSPETKVRTLMESYNTGLLSDKAVTEELQKFEVLPDTYDLESDQQRVKKKAEEKQKMMLSQQNMQTKEKPSLKTKPRALNSEGGSNAKS